MTYYYVKSVDAVSEELQYRQQEAWRLSYHDVISLDTAEYERYKDVVWHHKYFRMDDQVILLDGEAEIYRVVGFDHYRGSYLVANRKMISRQMTVSHVLPFDYNIQVAVNIYDNSAIGERVIDKMYEKLLHLKATRYYIHQLRKEYHDGLRESAETAHAGVHSEAGHPELCSDS